MAHRAASGLAGARRGEGGGAAAGCGAGPPAHGGTDPEKEDAIEEVEPAAGFVMEDAMAEEAADQALVGRGGGQPVFPPPVEGGDR
jgi:hypothetical protein